MLFATKELHDLISLYDFEFRRMDFEIRQMNLEFLQMNFGQYVGEPNFNGTNAPQPWPMADPEVMIALSMSMLTDANHISATRTY